MVHKLEDLNEEERQYAENFNAEEIDDDQYSIIMKSIKKERKKLTISFTAFALAMNVLAIVIL